MDKRAIIEKGKEVIRIEAASVAALESRIALWDAIVARFEG